MAREGPGRLGPGVALPIGFSGAPAGRPPELVPAERNIPPPRSGVVNMAEPGDRPTSLPGAALPKLKESREEARKLLKGEAPGSLILRRINWLRGGGVPGAAAKGSVPIPDLACDSLAYTGKSDAKPPLRASRRVTAKGLKPAGCRPPSKLAGGVERLLEPPNPAPTGKGL